MHISELWVPTKRYKITPLSASTICSHASAVSYAHKVCGLADPSVDLGSSRFSLVLRQRKARPSTDSRRALSLEEVRRLCVALLGLDRVDQQEFKAILLLGFFGLLRPGELVCGAVSTHTLKLSQLHTLQGNAQIFERSKWLK